jgi:hypothetical protein
LGDDEILNAAVLEALHERREITHHLASGDELVVGDTDRRALHQAPACLPASASMLSCA